MHTKNQKEFIEDCIEASKTAMNFKDIIKEASGFDVLPVNGEYKDIVDKIKNCIKANARKLSKNVELGYVGRSNELGNYIDGQLMGLIQSIRGFKASRPHISSGKRQSSGYPDIVVEFNNKTIYAETKTYQEKTKESTLRTFYFKPTEKEKFKVNRSCPHILIGFEVESKGEKNRSPFIVKGFRIVDLYSLKVNFKPEFNANNPMIYKDCKTI